VTRAKCSQASDRDVICLCHEDTVVNHHTAPDKLRHPGTLHCTGKQHSIQMNINHCVLMIHKPLDTTYDFNRRIQSQLQNRVYTLYKRVCTLFYTLKLHNFPRSMTHWQSMAISHSNNEKTDKLNADSAQIIILTTYEDSVQLYTVRCSVVMHAHF